MADDELAEINGIRPKLFLLDGEEREVSSISRQVLHPLHIFEVHVQFECSVTLCTKSNVFPTIFIGKS